MNLDDGVAGCSYWVLPAARGAGVASRALMALSGWALGKAGFHRLYLDHSTRNHASCRSPSKPVSYWRAPNAATPSTPTVGTTCTCTPASVTTSGSPDPGRPAFSRPRDARPPPVRTGYATTAGWCRRCRRTAGCPRRRRCRR
ncbi:GNAT family N-acetyltransferase [Micromonospora sp. NPDC057140]